MATISVILTNASDVVQASLTGLKWAWFDEQTPDLFDAPAQQGSGATTNGSGVFSVTSVTSSLTSGQRGRLEVTSSDGTSVASGLVTIL
jgi:hypothetical protein